MATQINKVITIQQ